MFEIQRLIRSFNRPQRLLGNASDEIAVMNIKNPWLTGSQKFQVLNQLRIHGTTSVSVCSDSALVKVQ